MQAFLLAFVVFLEIVASLSYILSILKGKTRPHRVTRFVLLIVHALNFSTILAAHGNMGSLVLAAFFVLQSILISILSIRRGMGGATSFDIACLAVALVGIIGWRITSNPVIGIAFTIAADAVAYLPAMVKTWKHPETESAWFYVLGGCAAAISLISYRLTSASAFQVFLVVNCLIMVVLIYRKRLGLR